MASFRDRFFTPRVAKAIMSPWRLLIGGIVGVVVGVLGAPIAAAIGVGAAVYAGTVASSVPRKAATRSVDSFALSEPWRRYVHGAQTARRQFDTILGSTQQGPIRERLQSIGERFDESLDECWRIGQRGDSIDEAITRMDVVAIRSRLGMLRARTDQPGTAEIIASLESQLTSADRLKATSAETASRLSLLQTRLDELVARAAEVSVGASDGETFSHDVDNLVIDLEGLRLALEETNAAADVDPALPAVSFTDDEPDGKAVGRPDEGTPGTQTFPSA